MLAHPLAAQRRIDALELELERELKLGSSGSHSYLLEQIEEILGDLGVPEVG